MMCATRETRPPLSADRPVDDKTELYGESALAKLGLPSARICKGLTSGEKEAYWVLAQAIKYLSGGGEVRGGLATRLPAATSTLQQKWPALPFAPPDATNARAWLDALQRAASGSVPASPKLLKYLAHVAELGDFSALDQVPDSDCTKVPMQGLWTGAPSAKLLSAENVILAFAAPAASKKDPKQKRRTLLRVRLTLDAADGVFRVADDPELSISRTAFFEPDGDARGEYCQSDVADTLLAPLEAGLKWQEFMSELDGRCKAMTGVGLLDLPLLLFGGYTSNLSAVLVDSRKLMGKGLTKIYADLMSGRRQSDLLDAILSPPQNMEGLRLTIARRDLFLGHMDEAGPSGRAGYSLDPTQRLAAVTAVTLMEQGEHPRVLPVNGPPGTGKTSFLRAVLASLWVAAAYEKKDHPPVVVGTGATNKAVSNVIEAFGGVADTEGSGFRARWLAGLPSYGWLFPSKDAAKDYPHLMHLLYDQTRKVMFVPGGGALAFGEAPLDVHKETYLRHAGGAMRHPQGQPWTVEVAVAELHRRIEKRVESLRGEQRRFREKLGALVRAWEGAEGGLAEIRRCRTKLDVWQAELTKQQAQRSILQRAVQATDACVQEQGILERGRWRWVRTLAGKAIVDWLTRERRESVEQLSGAAEAALKAAGQGWPGSLPEREGVLSRLRSANTAVEKQSTDLARAMDSERTKLEQWQKSRAARREAVQGVLAMLQPDPEGAHRQSQGITDAVHYVRMAGAAHEGAEDRLWQRFDARQDREWRFELFHLAARYWEGRWLLKQEEGEATEWRERLTRMMMLGVVVVATTYKLFRIGETGPVDLLVMDESGQCSPEMGVAALSFAKAALLVGDTKQLQPVAVITSVQSEALAKGLDLPVAFCGARGSAMAVARAVSPWTDGVDGAGVTLLYHYRCHPAIIGYCNGLLYGNKIHCVRPDKPTLAGLPPVSWVAVEGKPEKVGTSWRNSDELNEIARWIRGVHGALEAAYRKPLDEVLAIIAPLKGQANLAREVLKKELAGLVAVDVLDRLMIGTVHALQGAERPVVVFSLVQQRGQGSLYADRDGGFLMNVAVSRAKDAFIVFGERATLRAGPMDKPLSADLERLPVGRLGRYLRQEGRRLYPSRLVVVEAPGKVAAIQKALGLDYAVVATGGYLCESSLDSGGALVWSAPSSVFVKAIATHQQLVSECVMATDDDIAGELIGMQAAEVVAEALGNVPVRRMRFHSLEPQHLQESVAAAGDRFDADYLAAALTREAMHHLDALRFKAKLGGEYVSSPVRALVDIVDQMDQGRRWAVEVEVEDEAGQRAVGYVPANEAILAPLGSYTDRETAEKMARKLEGQSLRVTGSAAVERIPPLYPASTTQRILAAVADEHGILPWDTMDHLNAMYRMGAEVE